MRILNSIRKTMLNKSQFSRYLVYALGEIILVVIGILIALWVNRNNEAQKLKKSTIATAEMVLNQMRVDVKAIDEILVEWELERKTADTILRLTKRDDPIPSSCHTCGDLLLGVSFPTLTGRIPNSISGKLLSKGELSQALEDIEYHYLEGLKLTEFHEDAVIKFSTDNMEYWKDQFDWFSDLFGRGKCDENCKEYFYTSNDYRNRITYYELILLGSYYTQLEEFNSNNQNFIARLEALLKS